MANGELLLSYINLVQLYTYQYLSYITVPAKYSVRDLDFRAGSARFTEVISNIELTDEDKESLIATLDFTNLTHLDLPANYKQLLQNVVTIPKVGVHTKSDFEYAGVRLARAVQDLHDYFTTLGYDPATITLTDYIVDLGTGDIPREAACLTAISNLLSVESILTKLFKITSYSTQFNKEFPAYITEQMPQLAYLTTLYRQFKTDSYKPNDLPYLAIRN